MTARTYFARVTPAFGPVVIFSVVASDKRDAERRLRATVSVTRMAHPVEVVVRIVNHGIGMRKLWEVGT